MIKERQRYICRGENETGEGYYMFFELKFKNVIRKNNKFCRFVFKWATNEISKMIKVTRNFKSGTFDIFFSTLKIQH